MRTPTLKFCLHAAPAVAVFFLATATRAAETLPAKRVVIAASCAFELLGSELYETHREPTEREAIEHFFSLNQEQPAEDRDFRFRVGLGYESTRVDDLGRAAISFVASVARLHRETPVQVWDIGAATGSAFAHPLLYQAATGGLTNVYLLAVDQDPYALTLLRQGPAKALRIQVTENMQDDHLRVFTGSFPTPLRPRYESGSHLAVAMFFGAVLHFLSPEEVEDSLTTAFNSLEPGGKIFVRTASVGCFRLSPVLSQLADTPSGGASHTTETVRCGYFNQLDQLLPSVARVYGPRLNLMTAAELSRLVKKAGFEVQQMWITDPQGPRARRTEWVGSYLALIAKKPGELFSRESVP